VTRVAGDKVGNGEDARGRGMMVAMGHGLCVSFCLCGDNKNSKHLLRMGWRNFFQLCCCVSFLFLVVNKFWCYILTYLEYNAVVVLC
jgi:hypothetical protein